MVLVRFVCQARFGNANEVVAGFKQAQEIIRPLVGQNMRGGILTDLSGSFDAEAAMPDIIVSGQTEYYTIEAEWR